MIKPVFHVKHLGRYWQKIVRDSKLIFTNLEDNTLVLLRIVKSSFKPLLGFHFTLKIEVGVLLCASIIHQRGAVSYEIG